MTLWREIVYSFEVIQAALLLHVGDKHVVMKALLSAHCPHLQVVVSSINFDVEKWLFMMSLLASIFDKFIGGCWTKLNFESPSKGERNNSGV